jgi:hypothetical protein
MIEQQSATLIPELRERYEQVGEVRDAVVEATAGLTSAQLTWSPKPDVWSIAQVLDHMNAVARLALPVYEKGIAELRGRNDLSDGPFHYSVPERLFLKVVSPNARLRVPVPAVYLPATDPAALAEAVPEFLRHQDRLQALLASASGLNLTGIKVGSPADPRMKFSLGVWIHGAVTHEQYHLKQVLAVRADPAFPAA